MQNFMGIGKKRMLIIYKYIICINLSWKILKFGPFNFYQA